MAVDFGKLNKPGLHASFGSQKSRTGVSAQATKNLGNTTAASKSSIFSLNSRHSSNWVSGSRNNVDITKHNYQNMRANLNSRGFVPPQEGGNWGSFGIGSSGMNMGMMNGMTNINYNPNMSQVTGSVVGQVLNGTFGLLNNLGVLDGLKSSASSAVGDLSSAASSLGGSSSVASGVGSEAKASISSMKSAQNSHDLRSAIGLATSTLSGLKTTAAKLPAAEGAHTKAKTDLDTKEKHQETCETNLSQATQKREAFGAKLASAEAALKNTPETIKDANGNDMPNPEYSKLKTEVENLKGKLKEAEDAEKAAEKALEDAKSGVTAAKGELETAEKELDECKIADKDAKSLEAEISKQQTRLAKMEEKEAKEEAKLDTKIGENVAKMENLSASINPTDGIDKSERKATGKINDLNSKNKKTEQRRDEVKGYNSESAEIKKALGDGVSDFTAGGSSYEKVTTSKGGTFYYKDGQMISEADYNAAKPAS